METIICNVATITAEIFVAEGIATEAMGIIIVIIITPGIIEIITLTPETLGVTVTSIEITQEDILLTTFRETQIPSRKYTWRKILFK